jgi:hypothetical protein
MPKAPKKSKPKQAANVPEKKSEKKAAFVVDTKPEYFFLLIDGSTLKNIMELADSLQNMSDDVFYYHVTNDRNDFGNWVRDVFNEKELADRICKIHNKMEMQIAILRHFLRQLMSA